MMDEPLMPIDAFDRCARCGKLMDDHLESCARCDEPICPGAEVGSLVNDHGETGPFCSAGCAEAAVGL